MANAAALATVVEHVRRAHGFTGAGEEWDQLFDGFERHGHGCVLCWVWRAGCNHVDAVRAAALRCYATISELEARQFGAYVQDGDVATVFGTGDAAIVCYARLAYRVTPELDSPLAHMSGILN